MEHDKSGGASFHRCNERGSSYIGIDPVCFKPSERVGCSEVGASGKPYAYDQVPSIPLTLHNVFLVRGEGEIGYLFQVIQAGRM